MSRPGRCIKDPPGDGDAVDQGSAERRLMPESEDLSLAVMYEMMAELGVRRHFHLGGWEATRQLLDLCHLDRDKFVLDVGCASGKTACHVVSEYGCKVVGVDILEKMIDLADERAQREGVKDSVSFEKADAQNLPFTDPLFDVVLGEFITGLLDDRQRGVHEYLRVAKPGGIVGVNEATWLKTPVPEDIVRYLEATFGLQGDLSNLTTDYWLGLLAGAGLRDTVARTHKAETLGSRREGLLDVLRGLPKVVYMYIRNPAFRKLLAASRSMPETLLDYFGYGIYVGKK
jgi:SAM-dependent methyltransferase